MEGAAKRRPSPFLPKVVQPLPRSCSFSRTYSPLILGLARCLVEHNFRKHQKIFLPPSPSSPGKLNEHLGLPKMWLRFLAVHSLRSYLTLQARGIPFHKTALISCHSVLSPFDNFRLSFHHDQFDLHHHL
jgi:hypothetical protein